jgi:hypothetical protein
MTGRYLGIELFHAGGIGQMPRHLETLTQRYRQARPAETLPLRIIALADSDAKMPGHPSPQARNVNRSAATHGAKAHVLRKRTIENYVPDDALHQYADRHPDRREAITFVTSLSVPARDHYPLKYGLHQAELSEAGSMYPSGTPVGLRVGDFISDFLSDHSIRVEAEQLRRRDGVLELEEILDLLEENL